MEREILEKKVIEWGKERKLNDPVKQTLKTLSEAGELADAVCASNLETFNPDDEIAINGDIIDAIGDMEVCLTILKSQLKLPLNYPLEMAYKEIKDRKGKTVNGTFIKN